MTRVIRLSDFTMSLLDEYNKKLKNDCKKLDINYEYLVRTEQDLIQCALIKVINLKE